MIVSRRMGLAGLMAILGVCLAVPARAVDPKYLPGDTEVVIAINLQQMLKSEIAQQYKQLIDQGKGLLEAQIQNNPAAKYLEKSGFDLFRDLQGITVASNGSKDLEGGVIIIEGKFNPEKIQATAEEIARENPDVLKITKVGAVRVFEITPPGEKRAYAALLSDSILVASPSQETVKEIAAGSQRKQLKENFKSLLKTTSNKQSFSFAATGPALAKLVENAPVPNADAAAGMLQGVDGISAAVTLAKDVQFQLGVNAKDDETAKKTVAAGNFGLLTIRTLAAQKAKEDEKMLPLVDVAKTLRITSEGNNIVLRGEISVENIEKLIKNFPKNR